ncbi:hypothetical protein OH76DRAFT_529428 [Lentinus brumalis]|uniref:Fungal-type protein kinase domain-containing protein n=1 Tax=Lentinus brumalis TaxID=2498619 RepID=A0A371DA47_9APHY|nr:hypothetical protein OH76DRAFT_529428 [Polyporus brumalis]
MGPRFCQFTVDAFLARLPPPKPPTAEQREIFKGADLSKVKLEKDIYPLLTESIDSVFKAATAKNVRVLETPSHRAHDGHGTRTDTLNDAGIYLKNEAAVTATTLDAKRRVASKIDKLAERHHIGVRSWHWLAIPIEVKHGTTPTAFEFRESPDASPEPDPATQKTQKRQKKQKQSAQASSAADASEQSTASDPSSSQGAAKTFIRSSAGGEAALAQFIEYMLNVFDNQHRVFSYALYVWDHLARLCYFDRDGAVVSEEFKWTTPDSPLHDFLWRVATMSEAELGYDETAKRVKDDDDKVKRFKAMHNDPAVHEAIRPFVEQAVSDGYPIYKVTIIPMAAPPDEGFPDDPFPPPAPTPNPSSPTLADAAPPPEPKERSFLIGKPHFSSHSLIGRCTRGYIAYDIDGDRLCFLKDYWRPYVPNRTRPEHLVYERMARCGVSGIPTLICGGDVGGTHAQETKVHRVLHHLQNARPVPRSHYRMATVEIGLPLESFENFRELALVFADAVYTHSQAWEKAKVMHRDISLGNMLINPDNRAGLLIDWDLARVECELGSGPTEPERTGTWPFRSALGFVHAFDFLVLKYHPTDRAVLRTFVTSTYEEYSTVRGIRRGGDTKLAQIGNPSPPFTVLHGNTALQNILTQLHKGCHDSYKSVNLVQMQSLYGISQPKADENESGPSPPPKAKTVISMNISRAPPPRVLPPPDYEATLPTASVSIGRVDASKQSQSSSQGKTISTTTSTTTSATPIATTPATTSSTASDPCWLKGFLSHHAHLSAVLATYYEEEELDDKYPDQFKLRKGEDAIVVAERPRTHGISSMSMSTGSDLVPNLGHTSVGTSMGFYHSSDIPRFHVPIKRPRSDDDDEDARGGDAGPQAVDPGPSAVQPARQTIVSRMKKRQC